MATSPLGDHETTIYVGEDYEYSVEDDQETVQYSLGEVNVGYRVTDALHVVVSDQIGSLRASYNVRTETVSRQYYDPHGSIIAGGINNTDIGYTGQRLDRATGLMHYGARYYDPTTRTFTTPDILIPDPGSTQSSTTATATSRTTRSTSPIRRVLSPSRAMSHPPGTTHLRRGEHHRQTTRTVAVLDRGPVALFGCAATEAPVSGSWVE